MKASGDKSRLGNFYIVMRNDAFPGLVLIVGGRTLGKTTLFERARLEAARSGLFDAPVLASGAGLNLAMDDGMAAVAEAVRQIAMSRIAAASASLAGAPTTAADVDAARGRETETAKSSSGDVSDGAAHLVAVGLLLLWLWALTMPAAQELLPTEVKDYLDGLYATVALALSIHWRINDKRKP